LNENSNGTTPKEARTKIPVPTFQGIPDKNEVQEPEVVRAVSAMAGPVFTSPEN